VEREEREGLIAVTCTLKHVLGHSESVSIDGPPDAGGAKNAIQARASTITYLERYTLKAVCGIAEQGDDTTANAGGQLDENDYADHLAAIDGAGRGRAQGLQGRVQGGRSRGRRHARHQEVRRAQGRAQEKGGGKS
jgi:hypothetical protein